MSLYKNKLYLKQNVCKDISAINCPLSLQTFLLIILSVVNNELLTRINNEQRNAKVPNEIIAKFYLGGVIYMGITWLNDSSKYTKEEMIEYLSVLIPDNF